MALEVISQESKVASPKPKTQAPSLWPKKEVASTAALRAVRAEP